MAVSDPPVWDERPVWDDRPWAGFPRLNGEVRADLCVVGLGGSGLAAAGEALRLGHSVVGLDAGVVAGQAAGRNGGFLLAGLAQPHHRAVAELGRSLAVGLYRLTLAELDRITTETPSAVRPTGSLRLADSEDEERDCRRQLEAMDEDGLQASWYQGQEGRGLLFPDDAAMQPLERCRQVATALSAAGAVLHELSAAVAIGPGQVTTPAGAVSCRAVVVAVDGGLERLVPRLAGEVRTARLQMLATAPTTEVTIPRPVYARWGYDYWQQLANGQIALGGQRDRFAQTEWTFDTRPTPEVQAALDTVLRDRLGVRHAPVTSRWAASVGYSTGPLPVCRQIDQSVWAVGGYSGTGNVLGSLYGRAAARQALGLPLDGDLEGFPATRR